MKYEASRAVVERRPPVAHLVALGRLDLDHLGAVIAQDLGAVWPAQHPGQIDHPDAGERAVARSVAHVDIPVGSVDSRVR